MVFLHPCDHSGPGKPRAIPPLRLRRVDPLCPLLLWDQRHGHQAGGRTLGPSHSRSGVRADIGHDHLQETRMVKIFKLAFPSVLTHQPAPALWLVFRSALTDTFRVAALAHLGYVISDQTVGNILKRHRIPPTPKRKQTTTRNEFIRTHMEVLVATDFFTTGVWTWGGLVTSDVLFFIHLGSRRVHIAGATPHPNEAWMMQIARNMTMADWGFLRAWTLCDSSPRWEILSSVSGDH